MIELDQIKCEILEKSHPGMTIVNERDREKKSGSSICWVRDTEKTFKSNKIKKTKRKTYVESFGIAIKKGV